MPTTPTAEPASINAGDTAKWLKTLADYPAGDGWVLSYELVSAAQRYTFSATASGNDHLVTVPAATTAGWAAGGYEFRARASKAGEVYTVASGRITVKPLFSAAVDARSQARKTLEAINATLEGRSTSATAEYEIAGRRLKYIPISELIALQSRYERIVASEDAAAALAQGGGPRGRIYVRFGA
jgi:hypothetical protein